MVDVPRSLDPSDHERLDVLRRAMTAGNVDGESRAVGPIFRRDQLEAGATGAGGDEVDTTSSKIDGAAEWGLITDTATDTFTLTFDPVEDSWNVKCGWNLDKSEYTIVGTTLTILDPARVFVGASPSFTKVLEVQYDYFDGVPIAPTGDVAYLGITTVGGAGATHTAPAGLAGGELLLYCVEQPTGSTTPPTPPGWTFVTNSVGSGFSKLYLFTKVAAGGSADDVTRTGAITFMVALSAATVVATAHATATSIGTTWALPSVAVDVSDLVVVFVAGQNGAVGIAFSGDYITPDASEISAKVSDGGTIGMGGGQFTAAAAGTSPAQTFHMGGADSVTAITVAVRGS